MGNRSLQIADCRFEFEVKSQITSYQLPVINYQLPIQMYEGQQLFEPQRISVGNGGDGGDDGAFFLHKSQEYYELRDRTLDFLERYFTPDE